jgi:hypothetical protein
MIAGTARKQEPIRYLMVILGTLAVLATGVVGGMLAIGATSRSTVSYQMLPAPVTSDQLQPAGAR